MGKASLGVFALLAIGALVLAGFELSAQGHLPAIKIAFLSLGGLIVITIASNT